MNSNRPESPAEATIAVSGLTKSYGEHLAVRDLDLSVAAGRIVGLVGPNGAGKTSTLRCVAGILPATAGTVVIAGHDLIEEPLAAKRSLAFVPDTPHLFDYLTVQDHLVFLARLYGISDPEPVMDSLLERFQLDDKREALPGALSRGMSQKLAICMAFLHDPTALLLDEPLSGLDPLGIRTMKDAIVARARENGAAVVVSSHQLELVEEICDEIVIIGDGQIVISGTLDEIRARLGADADELSLEEMFLRAVSGKPSKGE